MPKLEKEQYEAFAQLRARGVAGAEAIRRIGYVSKTPKNTAVTLMKRPEVTARIAELRAEYLAAANRDETKASAATTSVRVAQEIEGRAARGPDHRSGEAVLGHLWDQVERSYAAGNLAAGTKALELLAKHHGLLIERKMEIKSPLDDLTADQLCSLLRLAERLSDTKPVTVDRPVRLPPIIDGEADRG